MGRPVLAVAVVLGSVAAALLDFGTGAHIQPGMLYLLIVAVAAYWGGTLVGLLAVVTTGAAGAVVRVLIEADTATRQIAIVDEVVGILVAGLAAVLMSRHAAMVVELRRQAHHDALTGVLNLRALMRAAEAERARAERTGDPLSVVFFDIDGLKRTNDRHGHEVGDRVLRDFAAVIAAEIRPYDIFGRIGGDEFVLVLPDTDQRQAEITVRRLQHAVRCFKCDDDIVISASSGVVTYLVPPDTVREMVGIADSLMYRSKRAGTVLVGQIRAGSEVMPGAEQELLIDLTRDARADRPQQGSAA